MGGFDLADYVNQQLKKGYTIGQITAYLAGYGYSRQQIESVMKPKHSFFHHTVTDPQLAGFVRQNLSRGYDAASIRSHLLASGYTSGVIDAAMNAGGAHTVHHVIHFSGKSILMLLGLIVIIAATGGIFFLSNSEPERLLDYELTVGSYEIKPGETLIFTNNFVNLGTKRKYDIYVDYKVTNILSREEIAVKGETIGVSTVDRSARTIDIPEDVPAGKYRLEGIARYGDDSASSYVNFNIIRPTDEETCTDGIRNQDEEDVDCGGVCTKCRLAETCFDGVMNQNEDQIDCGGVCKECDKPVETCFDNILNQDEKGIDCDGICRPCETPLIIPDNKVILGKVKTMGNKNENESLRLCNTIDNTKLRDECFMTISKNYNTTVYCAMIQSDSMLNICYVFFVQKGDYSVCEKIKDVYIKRSCESLRQYNSVVNSTVVEIPD